MNDKKLICKLVLVGLLLIGATIWFILSFMNECKYLQCEGWFARSGAILVLAAIWSSLLTRSMTHDLYEYRLTIAPSAKSHWADTYKIPLILLCFEFLLGSIGTLVWAYGDLWMSLC